MRFAGLVLALVALTSNAAELRGRVIGVADGDTVTVLDDAREQHKVRLSGIDAPERGQAFGDASKRNLSALAFNQTVTVEWHKRDRYGRLVGVVRVQPSDVDVGLAQIQAEMAWHYTAYTREQSAADQQLYRDAEATARDTRSGLWRDPSQVPIGSTERPGVMPRPNGALRRRPPCATERRASSLPSAGRQQGT